MITEREKEELKHEVASCLRDEKEIRKIIIFGSFLHSNEPHDLDVAVFQDSPDSYLPLAMKYRKKTRLIARKIPLDIFPIRTGTEDDPFLSEVAQGEIIYEK